MFGYKIQQIKIYLCRINIRNKHITLP